MSLIPKCANCGFVQEVQFVGTPKIADAALILTKDAYLEVNVPVQIVCMKCETRSNIIISQDFVVKMKGSR